MTAWLRTLAVLGVLIVLGVAWEIRSRLTLKRYRLTEAQRTAVTDSQRNKRPATWNDLTEPKK